MTTKREKMIVRFVKPVIEQTHENVPIARVCGFMAPEHLLRIVRIAGLEANPRYARQSRITKDIRATIDETPELLSFKSKGILIGCSHCKELDRNRYELSFEDHPAEGVLDGGHNIFALIQHLLCQILDEREVERKKSWKTENGDGLENLFFQHYEDILTYINKNEDSIRFFMSVEIIKPKDDEEDVGTFREHLIDICEARNNNAQLREETLANQEGVYDYLKQVLPKDIGDQVSWKTNDDKRISSRDITALAWIVLSEFEKPKGFSDLQITKVYNSKAECVHRFAELLTHKSLSRKDAKTNRVVLTDRSLKSVLGLIKDIPRLYDEIYKAFPYAYNTAGGSFGRIGCVSQKNGKTKSKTRFKTKFYQEEVDYNYPDGFIIPIVCGARALIRRNDRGEYSWATDPVAFFRSHLSELVPLYKGFIETAGWDPQRVGKNSSSYSINYHFVKMYTAK